MKNISLFTLVFFGTFFNLAIADTQTIKCKASMIDLTVAEENQKPIAPALVASSLNSLVAAKTDVVNGILEMDINNYTLSTKGIVLHLDGRYKFLDMNAIVQMKSDENLFTVKLNIRDTVTNTQIQSNKPVFFAKQFVTENVLLSLSCAR